MKKLVAQMSTAAATGAKKTTTPDADAGNTDVLLATYNSMLDKAPSAPDAGAPSGRGSGRLQWPHDGRLKWTHLASVVVSG